jgi:hypothetical protein
MRAEIQIETTVAGETNTFFFAIPKTGGGLTVMVNPLLLLVQKGKY